MSVEFQSEAQDDTGPDTRYTAAVDAADAGEAAAQAYADQTLGAVVDPEQLRSRRDTTIPVSSQRARAVAADGRGVERFPIPEQPTTELGDMRSGNTEAVHAEDPAAIPISELQQSPHYQRLMSEGEAGVALVPYLYKLAITRDDYVDRSRVRNNETGDEIDKALLDRLGNEEGVQGNSGAWQLTDILSYSLEELKARPELIEGGKVNWSGLSSALLDRATPPDSGLDFVDRHRILSSAVTAVLMAENPDDRITFLEQTAERRLSRPMASVLEQSDISVILPGYRNRDLRGSNGRADRSIHRLRNFRSAFTVVPDEVARYRQLVERDLGEPVDAHAAMQEAIDTPMTADGVLQGEHGEVLEDASVAPVYVDKYRIDPTKAERFALEEMFVQGQMDELFPNGDTSSFRRQLAQRVQRITPRMRAREDTEAQLLRLLVDTQTVIHDMSVPVVERYTIARPSAPPTDTWTQEQLAAWRYRQIHGKAIAYDNLAKFVDPTILGQSSNFNDNIYDIAENGAALPGIATEAVYNVIELAKEYQSATGDRITLRELHDLAQANRRQLMKLAAINMDDFSASIVSGSIGGTLDADAKRPAALDETIMVRKSDGKLGLAIRRQDGSLTPTGPLFKSETASSQAGARLACVALRVDVEGGPEIAKMGARNNKVNSIELLSKLIFDEAYQRGIFMAGLVQAA